LQIFLTRKIELRVDFEKHRDFIRKITKKRRPDYGLISLKSEGFFAIGVGIIHRDLMHRTTGGSKNSFHYAANLK
jgi:hypothetical protein